jgi:DeoR/GlpR family transcriptional regulator of sugar metabolism
VKALADESNINQVRLFDIASMQSFDNAITNFNLNAYQNSALQASGTAVISVWMQA